MYAIIKIGKPVHFRPNNQTTTACGLVYTELAAYDPRDVECFNCMKTKIYKNKLKVDSR